MMRRNLSIEKLKIFVPRPSVSLKGCPKKKKQLSNLQNTLNACIRIQTKRLKKEIFWNYGETIMLHHQCRTTMVKLRYSHITLAMNIPQRHPSLQFIQIPKHEHTIDNMAIKEPDIFGLLDKLDIGKSAPSFRRNFNIHRLRLMFHRSITMASVDIVLIRK